MDIISIMRSSRLALILISLVVIVVVVGGYFWATPRLIEIEPPPDAEAVSGVSSLRLTFSRPMLPETVMARLKIEPERDGDFRWDQNTLIFTPAQPWPSGDSVTVNLEPGARSVFRLPMSTGRRWSFQVEQPRLVYLWPSDGPADIYALDPISGETRRLTSSPGGISAFSVSPDGGALYYSAFNLNGGTDLYRLERSSGESHLLLACPEALCDMPASSPDMTMLAYQRIPLSRNDEPGPSTVHILRLQEGEPASDLLVSELERQTKMLDWSATGFLAFYDSDRQAFILHDPQSGESVRFPNMTGEPGDWSPEGSEYLAPEILLPGVNESQTGPAASHLMRFDSASGQIQDLTRSDILEDTGAVFSPDGSQLAFARKYLDTTRWTPGRQLWLMRADGGGAHPLTDAPHYNHSTFAWSPDGSQLAYKRFNQTALIEPPELWLINADGSDPVLLVTGGYDPQWIP